MVDEILANSFFDNGQLDMYHHHHRPPLPHHPLPHPHHHDQMVDEILANSSLDRIDRIERLESVLAAATHHTLIQVEILIIIIIHY